jgi:shikimate kinase/3-dehydroquinate synthase
MKHVVLSGFMGTGKSTVGPRLAGRLGVDFVDSDAEIERAAGKTVPEFWREQGEAAFRALEAEVVEGLLSSRSPRVIAFGGGTVANKATRRAALDRALVVTLAASPATCAARVPNVAGRPNLAVGPDPVARARELLADREAAYAECHSVISTEVLDVDAVVEAIVALAARDPLVVPLGTRSYCIDVCDGVPARLTHAVGLCAPSKVVLVTDSNVERTRGPAIDGALGALALPTIRVTIAPGEQHKTLASVGAIWDAALGAGVDRDAVLVAAGGGVVGDLAGFAAACLLRGVRFVQVPTSLLAMVDASVGGKTGFDHPVGKNLIGAFHQPSAVVVDLSHLETLPAREYRSGLAEVAKVALALDAGLLARIERESERLVRGDRETLAPVVRAAIAAKARIVRDDEREAGARALLNLGHTVGHALEAHGGYSRWLHGEAVSLGLVAELRAMVVLGFAPRSLADRALHLLDALGLPTRVSWGELAAAWPYVGADKKRSGDAVRFVVVTAPGTSHIERISLVDLRAAVLRGCE